MISAMNLLTLRTTIPLTNLTGFESINGQNVISSFNYQEKAVEQFDSLNEELRNASEKAEKYSGTIIPLTQMVNNIGHALSGLVGCLLALKGAMTVGNIQSALQYTKTFQQPFSTFAQMSSQISSAMAAGGFTAASSPDESRNAMGGSKNSVFIPTGRTAPDHLQRQSRRSAGCTRGP
jgi:ABC-type multidrug transport system fused ATPase/permease subunit